MKAVAVFPGKPDSVHLADLPKPSVDEIPGGRGVLVKVLRVGVDGTDKEINAAEYGAPPPGDDFLVIGHEGFGQVEAVGPNVTELQPGDYVVATVRRPGGSIYDLMYHSHNEHFLAFAASMSGQYAAAKDAADKMAARLADRKSTRLNSSHRSLSRMPSSA